MPVSARECPCVRLGISRMTVRMKTDDLATLGTSDLTFDDVFLSQEDSVAVIQADDKVIRFAGVNVDDLSESGFILV